MPIYYMDNLDFSERRFWGDDASDPFQPELVDRAVRGDGLYVFAFHPIHLSLNSPNPDEYFERRERFAAGASLDEVQFEGRGTRTFYLELVEAMSSAGIESIAMADALDAQTSTLSPLA
jgi:hypothetical protein